MFPFSGWVPLLMILLIGLGLWSAYEQWRFTRFEGPIRRGITIDTASLDWDTRRFLETMPLEWRDGRAFIRKEINEVLISADSATWQRFFGRRQQLDYVAYVNLSAPESRVEFRAPLAGLMVTLLGFVITFGIVFYFLLPPLSDGLGWLWLGPVVILVIFIGSLAFNHYRQRRRLLGLLSRARDRASYATG